MAKPTVPQAKFINAILNHGGDRVPGSKVFGKREHRITIKTATIDACKAREWVYREEISGVAYWTVTIAGERAVQPTDPEPCLACEHPGHPGVKCTRRTPAALSNFAPLCGCEAN
jgi:hypothetical protein